MTSILIRSKNKKAISAIKTLARELKMEVDESSEEITTTLITPNVAAKRKWEDLVKAGVVVPSDPSVKIKELAGIWTDRGITLDQLREKAWKRRVR